MSNPSKLSIITASYNSAKTIGDTFEAIRSQDYKDIEYIIVDGGSTDGTVEIIKKNEDIITRWISEPDKGIYDAMNKGIGMATGQVVGILNSDDFYYSHTVLSKVVDLFKKEKVDSVYSDILYVDPNNLDKVDRYWKAGNYDRKDFKFGWMPPHPGFFVKKKVYEKFGTFDLRLKSAADYEFMLRVLYKHGISSAYLDQVTVKMRSGGNSNSSIFSRINGNKEDRLAWKINELQPYFFTTYLKPARKVFQFIRK